jgi:HlyD family secretion protein
MTAPQVTVRPQAKPRKPVNRRWQLRWLPVAAALALAAAWGMMRLFEDGPAAAIGKFYTAAPADMDIRIAKDGELQAINNIDIISEVEGANTIQQLVKEGTWVKKGDVLVTLDSKDIKEKIEDTTLDVQKAEADLTNATEMKEIQESQNATNLDAAQVQLMVAKLDLQQYSEGTYPQQLANVRTDVEMDQITLNNRLEDLAQTRNLLAKGFVTAADVKKAELDVTNARNELSKSKTTLHVLQTYTHEMDLASRKNNLAQAEARVNRTRRENASNLAWRSADLRAKEQALVIQKRRLEHSKDQFEKCTIKAPADGLVVYSSTVDRHRDNPIQEGAQVREREMIIRLPDVSAMKAVVRIQEAQVSKLMIGQRALVRIVGLPEPVEAKLDKISVLADNSQRWWNPDLKEYPVDLVLERTPPDLKPGAGVQAEVFVGHLSNVLTVPLASIYSAGEDRYVFVRDGESAKPHKVTIGASNDTQAEVKDGLASGQDVLLLQPGQGRDLLEKAGIKVQQPTSRPGDSDSKPAGTKAEAVTAARH